MNSSRAMRILENQSRLAQRVFAAVPKQEYWSVGQISNEMNRLEKHNHGRAVILGCLNNLVDAGLVTEAGTLTFRSNVKPPAIKETSAMNQGTPKAKAAAIQSKPSLGERLMEKASILRGLADDLDTLAIEVEETITNAGAKNEKLVKLQDTLRGLMADD